MNTSTFTPVDDGADQSTDQTIYIVCQGINSCLMVATLWILLCLVMYGVRTKKWAKKSKRSDMNGGMVYTASVIAVAATIPRYIADQIIFSAVYIDGALRWCEFFMDTGNATYFMALYPIYLFLWFRQKALYGHPAMKRLAGKCVSVFGWVTLVGLSLAAIGVGLMFVVPSDYTGSPNGCVVDLLKSNSSYSTDVPYRLSYYVLVVLLIVAQLSLLSLFIYPMVRSNAIQNSRRLSQSSTKPYAIDNLDDIDGLPGKKISRFRSYMSTIRDASRKISTSSLGKKPNTVQKTIRRSVACASISMVSDVLAMAVVSFVIPQTVPRSLTNTVYDISTLVSVLSILATFSNYRDILTVCFRKSPSGGSEKLSQSGGDDSRAYSDRSYNQTSSV
uniref:uncharacterized protein LOC120346096 n=1 Tax=Styela clava TaxID=7725 RepID=UPI00193A081C|nr:uncharacterized protein LOC120346096 [Styela clava]